MSGAGVNHSVGFSDRGQAFWLPYGGWGNGLDADQWAGLLEVNGEPAANLLLDDFRAVGIPAYAAITRSWTHRHPGTVHRIGVWVDAAHHGSAESMLISLLPRLIELFGKQVIP